MEKIIKYFKEVRAELKKVTWSKLPEVRESTMIVIMASTLLGFFLWIVDSGLARLLDFLISGK